MSVIAEGVFTITLVVSPVTVEEIDNVQVSIPLPEDTYTLEEEPDTEYLVITPQ